MGVQNRGVLLAVSSWHVAAMYDLHQLASTQYGLVSRTQLRTCEISRQKVQRWKRDGRLHQLSDHVYALAGSVDSPERRVLAVTLETRSDAWASHTTAAWVWNLRGFSPEPFHVAVDRHSRHHEHLPWQVHQFTGLPGHHRRVVRGIPVTSPALTMLHLAQVLPESRLGRAIDNAWSERILTGQDLFALDSELARQGRNGIVALREAAEKRGIDWVPPASNLEARFIELVDPLGKRGFERQAPLAGPGWNARVDFLHKGSRTIIEIQSERHHASLTDREADRLRIRRLESLGYRVLEVWDTDLFHKPGEVIDRVNRAVYRVA